MPRAKISYVKWKVTIPSDVAAQIELANFDPITGKPRYGSRSELLTSLLRQHLSTLTPVEPEATNA